jgi:Rieske Fe-S protein/antitoxin component of MazEF toxin-antitoxin module
MTKRLQSVGNSSGVIIDKPILELLGITPDTELDFSTDGERLIITPVKDQTAKLAGFQPVNRRNAIKLALGLVLATELAPRTEAADEDAKNLRPQPGDQLVFAEGERRGAVISVADIRVDGPQLSALPLEPRSGLIRDGSRLNKILLVRSSPESLSEETRRRSVDGIVAYSAICTHQGCEVGAWDAEAKNLWCACHDSKYDPKDGARVTGGPAPRRLATLPLKNVDGVLTVAASFTGPVGLQNR